MKTPADTDEIEDECLRQCYHAFLARRVARGGRSLRTRRGFEKLRANYQPRVGFLLDHVGNDPIQVKLTSVSDTAGEGGESLKELVGPFVDERIIRFVADVCWPLAHFGPAYNDKPRMVLEWQELSAPRYFAMMVSVLLWMFPGLPSFELQEIMENDWQNDRDFDAYGSEGLSLEGFTVSLIDLAVACTGGAADKCLRFLQEMVVRLQSSLPVVPDESAIHDDNLHPDSPTDASAAHRQTRWHSIPLGQLVPCQLQPTPQYYELKAKVSSAPMILMVLAGSEKLVEFQLSSSAKLLVREGSNRSSLRRKTIALKTHLIEMEKQILWTFRDWNRSRPSIFLIPSESISRKALKLFGCLRLLENHEEELHVGQTMPWSVQRRSTDQVKTPALPIFTLHTSIQEPTPLSMTDRSPSCGRIDRLSSQLFVLCNHPQNKSFSLTIKTSLLQSMNSAGGAGAAAAVSHSTSAFTSFAVGDSDDASSSITGGDISEAAHTFIFVVKETNEVGAPFTAGVHRRTRCLPKQWFSSISATDETKELIIQADQQHVGGSDSEHHSTGDSQYYLYMFSVHGVYFEIECESFRAESISAPPAAFFAEADNNTTKSNDDYSHAIDKTDQSQPVNKNIDEHTSTHRNRTPSNTNHFPQPVIQQPVNASHPFVECNDELDHEEQNIAPASKVNSAMLLQHLLQIRQKQKLPSTSSPLPAFVEGAKVSTVKTLTSAVSLRAKYLRARELARQARLVERDKFILMATSDKLRNLAPRCTSGQQVHTTPHIVHCSDDDVSSPTTDFEDQASNLASFFRGKANQAMTESKRQTSLLGFADIDGKLLSDYSDLFGRDVKLRGMLDEEIWQSDERKEARRMTELREQVRSGLSSDNSDDYGDYVNTAEYLEQLLRDDIDEQNKIDAAHESKADRTVQHLADSWAYAQYRTDHTLQQQQHRADGTSHLEVSKREEWLQSVYASKLRGHVGLSVASSPAKVAMTLSTNVFDSERDKLPWSPVWEQYSDEKTGVPQQMSPRKPSDSNAGVRTPNSNDSRTGDTNFVPSPPLKQRPKSTSSYDRVSTRVSAQVRDEAKASASFAFSHKHRLQRTCSSAKPKLLGIDAVPESGPHIGQKEQAETVCIPQDRAATTYKPDCTPASRSGPSASATETFVVRSPLKCTKGSTKEEVSPSHASKNVSDKNSNEQGLLECDAQLHSLPRQISENEKANAKKQTRKKKQKKKESFRMTQRVRELLTISEVVRNAGRPVEDDDDSVFSSVGISFPPRTNVKRKV